VSSYEPSTESHRDLDGLCTLDSEDWPCSAVPLTEPGYDAAWAYGQAQRSGSDAWPDDRGKGVQVFARTPKADQ
jgi:hypothetical protein